MKELKIVIAADSFKGSLSSAQVAEAICDGLEASPVGVYVDVFPLADGGEGTAEALKCAFCATECEIFSTDPLKRSIKASYCIADKTAIIEMSACAGIGLLSESERLPKKRPRDLPKNADLEPYLSGAMKGTTFGVGLMLRDAIVRGCRKFIIGLGGSATNDCGAGMLQALGFELLDKDGNEAVFGALGLGSVVEIRDTHAMPELKECEFEIACDVTNPLLGESGCTYVYSPQKGATPSEMAIMEGFIAKFAEVVKKFNPNADPNFPGCGAAGGMGFAFLSFLNARLVSGVELVINATGVEDFIKTADILITGEGKIDAQSMNGKAPIGVAKIAKKYGKRVIALCGKKGDGYEKCFEYMDEIYEVADPSKSLEENMKKLVTMKNIKSCIQKIFS